MRRGKAKKILAFWMLVNLIVNMSYSDIRVDRNIQQNTSIDRSQNGANIVNINTPNNKGISVNDFSEFRTKDPTVFNNFGEGVGRSYLAGMMASNPNLTKDQAARLILNRVGGNNRAEIENWLEVMSGNKTDLIFSSQNGFYLNNTGFINFDKVIFTTSRVYLDGNGDIQPFNIRGGNIEIGRQGVSAEGLQYLALLSKQISIDGMINAKDSDIDIIAGEFDYNPDTREYTKKGINNNEMLISASAYGSVYGNQVKVVAVNGNLGVNSDLIGYKVLSINADGSVRTNKMHGTEGIEVKGKEFVQEGSSYSEGSIVVSADKTTLKGAGTQARDITVSGELNNYTDMYTEGSIIIGSNTLNYGKILSDNILHINGVTVNEGTLYGKNSVKLLGLTNNGNIQSTGNIQAQNVINKGKVIAEGSILFGALNNQNELVTNKTLTVDNLTNSGNLSSGEGINVNGNVINSGELKTNRSFLILGNLNNFNLLNTGGILSTRDLLNYGNLKVVEKLLTQGTTFYNQGEILTSNLDVNNINIHNVNKITVIETVKLQGNNINNDGYLSGTNVELMTSALTNTNTLIADKVLTAQNTALNNTGYIGSNQKMILSGSNISNQGSLESNIIEMYNLSGYNNNSGSINGAGVYLTTSGNIDLRGSLHGESDLRINGYDIWNNGITTGTGYIELKGHDITNNTGLSSGSIVIEGTGNIVNNNIITGVNGNISGYNLINNDLIAFSEQTVLRASDKITNNAGKAIYGGNLLDAEFNTLENLSGDILSTGVINLRGNYLLNQTGQIQSSEDIALNVTKIDNIGRVDGLTNYEIYYETWDGQILSETEVMNRWRWEEYGENKSNKLEGLYRTGLLAVLGRAEYQFLLANIFLDDLWALDPNAADYKSFRQGAVEGYFDRYPMDNNTYVRTSSTQFPGVALKGKLKSNAITTYANISAGGNIVITGNELNNTDGKISAGNTAELTVGTIRNNTTLGGLIQLKDGVEYYKQEHYGKGSDRKYHVKYWRGIENGDKVYVTGQASVIEAGNLIINTGNLELTSGVDTSKQIITGSTTAGGFVSGIGVNTGVSNGTGIVNITKNMTPLSDIKATGILPIDPLGAQSSLFTMSKDPTSKYLLETRGQYISIGEFYGSDYYLSRIGYDEGSDWNKARRLGDAYYEYLLVTRAISDKLGTRFINGLSDKELMKAMLDNSVELQKDLQLTVGVALTADQVKALKSDVVWYEYEIVEGERVLVPKVYLSQATLSTIETDGRDKVGGLHLTAITADELRNNGQLIGGGGVTYINAGRVYNVTDTNQLAEIRGDQVSIIATAGNIENTGGLIRGKESLVLVAEQGNVINNSSKVISNQYTNSQNNTQHENLLSVGEMSSDGTTYINAQNYDSKAGALGGKTVVLDVKENVTIGALELSGTDNSGGGDNYAVYRNNQNVGGVVSAENLYVTGKNLNIEGSTVAVTENALLNVEKINIESKVNDTYTEFKGSDKGTFSSRESLTKAYDEENVAGALYVGGSTITKADINIIGSTFVTGDDSYLGGNVTSTSRELNSSYYHQEKKTGFTSNFDVSSGGVTAGAGIKKTEDTIDIHQTTQAMSNVVLGHGTIVDGDKFSLSATNFQHGAITVNSKEVYYGATKNTYDEKTEHKETYIGISASISSPLINRATQMYDGVDAATKGNGTVGLVNGGVSVINSAVGFVNGLSGNQKGASNDFYVSASAGLTMSTQESKSHSYYETGVVTTISGLDEKSSITYNNTDKITYVGTQSYGDTFIYNNVKEIEKTAVELNNYYSSSSSSTSLYGGMSFDSVTGRPGGANFSVSGSNSNYTQSGTSYQNGLFVGVNETYNNVGKMTIDGFEQYGGKVTGNIAELDIRSRQNTSDTSGSSSNYSVGTGFQTIGTAGKGAKDIGNNAMKGLNGSIGGSTTEGSRSYVDTPSAFLVGDGSDLTIGKVTNTGAVIGIEEGSKGKMRIDEYTGKNINNSDTYNTTGATVGSGGVGFEYQDKDKKGITHNTVIGSVDIGSSTGDEINRDINKVQETTKDKDSGYYNTFVESGVLVLATEKGRKDFKDSIKLAGEEINAMKEVIQTTLMYSDADNRALLLAGDSANPDKEKRSFIDVLQTERFQEGIRNAGYIDLSGKSDKEIKEVMQNKYGDLFERFGKDLEVGFYTNDELSADDPMAGNKRNSMGFVGEDGKVWLNKSNITDEKNFNMNNVFGHEGVHVVKGGNSELLAQFGERRSSDFIQDAIDSGKLSAVVTQPVKDWDKGTLTEKEKGDLARVQEIEEKLQLTKYLDATDHQRLQDDIRNKFGENILTNYDNLGKDNKDKIAESTKTALENRLESDIKTILSSGASADQKQELLDKYGMTMSDLSGLSLTGDSITNFVSSENGQKKLIEANKNNSEAEKLLNDILNDNKLNNNQKISEINKKFGVILTTDDLAGIEGAKDKVYNNITFKDFIAKDTDKLATDVRNNSDFVTKFIEKSGLLTSYKLSLDDNDFVTYSAAAGRSYNKQGDKLFKEVIDHSGTVQVEKGNDYTEQGAIIDGRQGSVITVKDSFGDHQYMRETGKVVINGILLSISDGVILNKGAETAIDHELIHSLNRIEGKTDTRPGLYLVVKQKTLLPGDTYNKNDVVVSVDDIGKKWIDVDISRNATDVEIKALVEDYFNNLYPVSDPKNSLIREQLNKFGIDTQVQLIRKKLDVQPYSLNPNSFVQFRSEHISTDRNAVEEENTSGVNGRNTSNGYNENQLYGPSDKRGSYPILNGF